MAIYVWLVHVLEKGEMLIIWDFSCSCAVPQLRLPLNVLACSK